MFKIYCPVIAFLVFVTSANIKCQSQENDDDEINRNNGSSVNYVIAKFGSGLIRGRVSYAAGPHRPSHVFLVSNFAVVYKLKSFVMQKLLVSVLCMYNIYLKYK